MTILTVTKHRIGEQPQGESEAPVHLYYRFRSCTDENKLDHGRYGLSPEGPEIRIRKFFADRGGVTRDIPFLTPRWRC